MRGFVYVCSSFVLVAAGCDLSALIPAEARTIEVPAESEVTVPGAITVGQSPLAPEEVIPADFGDIIGQELEQTFSTEDIQKEAVDSMKLTTMHVEVDDPEENGNQVRDLGFLESASFYLSAGELEPVLVAFSEEGAFASDPIEYDFALTDEELVPVLNAGDEMAMTADVELDGRPWFATTLLFHVMLTVVVDPEGAVSGAP